ncbi:DNA cytosine methyltransferase [Rhodoblastus acidophilus]|uniref:Cytosine-specific methyltransferase n=1 Tax=Candidatus Rhodoblastus alkanivorans TaxID=2954117 RepID=A0ABS9Z7Q9_9HYPH|nr:DNA cytosine methyltransferase [Candidatus Rhodoblastus alkanivorans]MCI4679622.1 DNA cytosine methyltransferase [Candidatus Rhodoblastus alkanivorans]MCI4683658.1 DNA cytosine methyltransferase [Candidatus Rhodoblastus alkanivorans]MDI4640974.1 DNA cytosine methyltransferase [Rhodoblastus acidophilus]
MGGRSELKRSEAGAGIRVLSLFTGAGGLDLGFELQGFETVYASDIDQICCETLELNKGSFISPTCRIQRADIRELSPETLPGSIDLIIGGPPCQSFSASGRRAGGAPGRLDSRGTLFEAYCRIVGAVRPKAFLFENVRGILGTSKGEDWAAIVKTFGQLGYRINYRILDALDYGAPQQRERLVLVGHTSSEDFLFPRPMFGPDSTAQSPHVTTEQALDGLIHSEEELAELAISSGKYAHLLPLVPPGSNYLHFTAKRGYPSPIFAYRSRFSDFLYKANPKTPIKTLIARPGKYTGPLHWENRYFSLNEYKRLQGFPDCYKFSGSHDDVIRQIGNSVSPKLSGALALAIAKQIFQRTSDIELLPAHVQLSFDTRKGLKAKRTRLLHQSVQDQRKETKLFKPRSYIAKVEPFAGLRPKNGNVRTTSKGTKSRIEVHADNSGVRFASMQIKLGRSEAEIGGHQLPEVILNVELFGQADHGIQTMWNAVDDWVIRSSGFHSLFELYGHFTEPHPIFEISDFKLFNTSPVARFAQHVSHFANCSTYYPRSHLVKLFGNHFHQKHFVQLTKTLRSLRFDIRCHETNVAIGKDVYMVAYPFTLPMRRQMNFSVAQREQLSLEGAE